MGLSFWHMLLILIVVFVVFGAGKLPKVMGDVGKGIRNLRDELKADNDTPPAKVENKDNAS
jgi:sec-independent protein translocase protein TatA